MSGLWESKLPRQSNCDLQGTSGTKRAQEQETHRCQEQHTTLLIALLWPWLQDSLRPYPWCSVMAEKWHHLILLTLGHCWGRFCKAGNVLIGEGLSGETKMEVPVFWDQASYTIILNPHEIMAQLILVMMKAIDTEFRGISGYSNHSGEDLPLIIKVK